MLDEPWRAFSAAVEDELAEAIKLREQLHRAPMLSGEEGPTLELVLAALGISEWEAVAETGAIVRIGPKDGPAIGIRAELDALPIAERTGAPFASTNGAMHACGHDVHIAAAVAVAKAAIRVSLPFAIVLILQPREEAYPSGAKDICESGLLEKHQVVQVFGAHVHPRIPSGGIAIGGGAVNAAADEFNVEIVGVGGHAAYPHHARNPIAALGAVIVEAQRLVSRAINPMNPAVLHIGAVSSGSAANVVPDRARMRGSIRTMDRDDRDYLHAELPRLVSSISSAHGCSSDVVITKGEPILVNDEDLARAVRARLEQAGVVTVEPMRSCGSDDFSFYSELIPGVMMFVGVGEGEETPALHSPTFLPPESAVQSMAMAYVLAISAAVEVQGIPAGAAEAQTPSVEHSRA